MQLLASLMLALLWPCDTPALAADAPADPALLGDWRFDEAGGDAALDGSPNMLEGEIRGARWARGRFGGALYFGGENAYVTLPGLDALDGSEELTVEAWVYWERGGRYPNIVTGGTWCPGGFLFFVQDDSCSFRMGKPSSTALQVGRDWAEVSAPLVRFTPNRWYHLAATFRRPDITTYVDGQPVGSAKWDYPVGFSGELQLGFWGNPATCHAGLMDNVKVYRRALSGEEVAACYADELAGREPPVAGQQAYELTPVQAPQPAVALESDLARVLLDKRGRVVGLIDKATGADYCADPYHPFATVKKGTATYRPSSCSLEGDRLTLEFGRLGAAAQVRVTGRGRYLVLEVLSVGDPEVEQLVIGSMAVTLADNVSGSVAWASDERFAAAVVPLNLQVEVALSGGKQPVFAPKAVRKYGLSGARIAIAGCPTGVMRDVLKDVVRNEGLPYSPLGGPFAFDAEENRGSYLFAAVSESNVEEWIRLAHLGGFAEVHLCPWWRGLGHYEPNPDLFPNGLEGLRQVVGKLHAAGLKVGMHTLTGCIQVDDPWVSPVPDKRLAKDRSFTLAADVGPDDTTISTVESPEGLQTFWGDMSTGNTVQIGHEIIAFRGLSTEAPYGFTECTRGQWKTLKAAHEKGATADHLIASYCAYMPDESTALVDELADCIANTFNTCGFDMIYLDGSEGMKTAHAVAVMKRAIFNRLRGRVLVESSSGSWGAWPFHSRVGAWDHPKWGFDRFTDQHCLSLERYSANEMLPGHMGWWVITGPAGDWAGMFPEDMEYSCAKCLGWDYSISLQGVAAGKTPPNARQDEYLAMLGRYERLRLARYFSDEVRQKLRVRGDHFRLHQAEDGSWQLVPTDYAAHRVTALQDDTATWTVDNRYAAQEAGLRIEALYACRPYESEQSVLVADFADPEVFTAGSAAAGVTQSLTTSTEQVAPGAAVSGCLVATNSTGTPEGAWAKTGIVFDPPLDIGKCGALGVWVYGDGKGELLNFQLNNDRENYTAWDEHYVDVDFTGWRYFELLLRERDAQRHQDYIWPYGGACTVGRHPIVRNRVGALNIYTNNLPPDEQVCCFISPVRAVPVFKTTLANPVITIGRERIAFPVTLHSGQYVEYESADDCRLHDERGAVIRRFSPQGGPLAIPAGPSTVSLTAGGAEGLRTRAKVTLITRGEPLTGRAPAETVNNAYLRTEHEAPRVLTGAGSWDVLCRPDAGPARLEACIAVERAGKLAAGYESPAALSVETFDDLARFADTPENRFAQYAYDGEDNRVPNKPGVNATLEVVTEPVKVGSRSVRYSATSTRGDNAGWCARGARFSPTVDLSGCTALGFWLHGDAGGESFKLQLRDTAGAWFDMVTPVGFRGWKYVEFDLGDAHGIRLDRVEYVIAFFNGIPGGATVTCHVDDIRGLRSDEVLCRPALAVRGQRVVLPVSLTPGERVVYRGAGECAVLARDGAVRQTVKPEGRLPALRPGRNRVRFAPGEGSAEEFQVTVSLTKVYPVQG